MSERSSYLSEPATNGKVLITTDLGEIDVELWSKEAPKACRNFVQLCLEGYYDGCKFHRVVKDFIIQTGDPTGSGQGGESIYGEPFKDEFHSRLKYIRRGMVSMANHGPNTNQSQFFITLTQTPWLEKKNTVFGKVAGDTIYNVLKFNELELVDDKPRNPPKIIRMEVLHNPFPDIIVRREKMKNPPALPKDKDKKKKKKKKVKKNLSLLSFGEEAEAEETEDKQVVTSKTEISKSKISTKKSKSSHDLLSDDPRLLKESSEPTPNPPDDQDPNEQTSTEPKELTASGVRDKLKKKDVMRGPMRPPDPKGGDEVLDRAKEKQNKKQRKEYKKLKKEVLEYKKQSEKKKEDISQEKTPKEVNPQSLPTTSTSIRSGAFKLGAAVRSGTGEVDELLTPLEQRRKKYLKRKKSTKRREDETLAKLASFKDAIITANTPNKPKDKPTKEDTVIERGKEKKSKTSDIILKALEQEEKEEKKDETLAVNLDDEDGENEMVTGLLKREFGDESEKLEDKDTFLAHRITFTRRPQDYDHMARQEELSDYAVFDPRENKSKGSSSGGRDRPRDSSSSSSNSLGIDDSEWNGGRSSSSRGSRDNDRESRNKSKSERSSDSRDDRESRNKIKSERSSDSGSKKSEKSSDSGSKKRKDRT